jgi:uncharacterized membrane protein
MSAPAPGRLVLLDAARGLAVVAMVAYHLVWDLGNFDYIDPEFPYSARFKGFGHAIALSFLFIAGVSLVLAHERNAGFGPFWRRLARIAAAAALVSLGTYLVFPQSFVFFGILHCIAAASLLAAPFLSLPWPAALATAIAAFLAPLFLSASLFDPTWLSWIGLSTVAPLTNDYQPLLPWSAALFAGVAFARFPGALHALGAVPAPQEGGARIAGALRWLGRHSLAIYLLHQPLLFGVFLALARLSAPSEDQFAKNFVAACETRCEADGGAIEFCSAACLCVEARASDLPNEPAERALRLKALADDCVKP